MLTVSFKKYISLTVLLFSLSLSCGCDSTADEQQPVSETSEEGLIISIVPEPVVTTEEAQEITTSKPAEAVTEEPYVEITVDLSIYDTDNVPKEWLSVYKTSEALEHFDEIINVSTEGDISRQILDLVNRNVLCFGLKLGSRSEIFDIDWDKPAKAENSEAEIYPISSQYFSDLESIERLMFNTYDRSFAENTMLKGGDEKAVFFEIDNQLYVDPDALSRWVHDPFRIRSYIEIIEASEDSCKFVWHYPDFEGLNEPEEYKFFYFDTHYTAKYVDGKWLLSQLIIDNHKDEW